MLSCQCPAPWDFVRLRFLAGVNIKLLVVSHQEFLMPLYRSRKLPGVLGTRMPRASTASFLAVFDRNCTTHGPCNKQISEL